MNGRVTLHWIALDDDNRVQIISGTAGEPKNCLYGPFATREAAEEWRARTLLRETDDFSAAGAWCVAILTALVLIAIAQVLS